MKKLLLITALLTSQLGFGAVSGHSASSSMSDISKIMKYLNSERTPLEFESNALWLSSDISKIQAYIDENGIETIIEIAAGLGRSPDFERVKMIKTDLNPVKGVVEKLDLESEAIIAAMHARIINRVNVLIFCIFICNPKHYDFYRNISPST